MGKSYSDFNMYNCAPDNCGLIAVYKNNTKIGYIKVPKRMIVSNDKKLYSFLSISDSHTVRTDGDDGTADLTRAIAFANNNDIAFVCHCGDTADSGTDYHMTGYKNIVANCTKPVYAISGNHQEVTASGNVNLGYNDVTQYHGYPLYYSFEYKNDVFIMLGESGYTTESVFCDGELQFMYDTLEANRNKRCFVYQHVFNWEDGDSGNPNKLYYAGDLFTVTGDIEYRKKERQCFLDMLKHYKNTIWVHGHSHALLELQSIQSWANYSENLGYRSLHNPSIAKPKNSAGTVITEASQGYVIDVYDNFIVVKGRDFVQGEYLPIATYKIDTTLQNINEGTFVDSTGILSI